MVGVFGWSYRLKTFGNGFAKVAFGFGWVVAFHMISRERECALLCY